MYNINKFKNIYNIFIYNINIFLPLNSSIDLRKNRVNFFQMNVTVSQ